MIEYKVQVYSNGSKSWYLNDKRHCEHGPSIEWADGYKEWWIKGVQLTEEQFNSRNKVELSLKEIANKFNIPLDKLRIKK